MGATNILSIILIIAAYLCGSIATAVIVSRSLGLPDPRSDGSGNPGATNVLRLGGKKAAVFTLLGDALKGLLPILAGRALEVETWTLGAIMGAAFLGHLYPIFFAFKGGKGVATAMGIVFGLSITLGGTLLLTWLALTALFRYSSLAALVSAVLAPIYALIFTEAPVYSWTLLIIAGLLVWRHRENIRRLINRQESKLWGN